VLVIEDNPVLAESLREALLLGGHEVTVAYSGPEGLEAAPRQEPRGHPLRRRRIEPATEKST
jgi:CheY-like chemotaxis protein